MRRKEFKPNETVDVLDGDLWVVGRYIGQVSQSDHLVKVGNRSLTVSIWDIFKRFK